MKDCPPALFRLLPYSLLHSLLLTLFWVLPSFAQQTWTKTFGGLDLDRAKFVQQTRDGGYIIAGYTFSFGVGSYDVWLIKTNASGDTLWTRTYGGPGADAGYSVQQTLDGGYIIAGETWSFGDTLGDVYLIRTNATGDTLWTRTYGGPARDLGWSVRQTLDGGYIVSGTTESFGLGRTDVWLIRTNPSGDTLWTRTYGGTDRDEGYMIQQTQDSGFVLTGCTFSFGAGASDVWLLKTNPSGDTLWTRTYGGISYEEAFSIQQTSDGGYIVVGHTGSFGNGAEAYLIKTNASGDTLWTKFYGGTSGDVGYSVQQTSDGGYVIAGWTYSFGAGLWDVYLIRTNASGDTLWTRSFGGTSNDYAYSIQQTQDGGYIVAGYTESYGAGNGDAYLIKTDENGHVGIGGDSPGRFRPLSSNLSFSVVPNPFISFVKVPGHEADRFALYDISGRRVGVYKGARIGFDLRPGIYFIRSLDGASILARIVKVK